jgi:hypothetical protein
MRNKEMCRRNLGIQNAVCHRSSEICNTKYGNMSEEFRNIKRSLSQEFREMSSKYGNVSDEFRNTECIVTGIYKCVIRSTVMCQRSLGIENAVCHRNLESCNTK